MDQVDRFPQIRGADVPEDAPIPTVTPTGNGPAGGHRDISVLHVDDEQEIAELTATHLERLHDDFSVVTETDATIALERLRDDGRFDCVVSDYEMPSMDGLEFLGAVREIDPDLPFILFTGKGSEEIASEAIRAGVTDYMQKAIGTKQYEVLANRIRNAVYQYRTEQELWMTLSWYKRLVEQNLAGIYLVHRGTFVYVNERMANLLGYGQGELVGRTPFDVFAEEDHEVLLEAHDDAAIEADEDRQYAVTGVTADGEELSLRVHAGVVDFRGELAVMGVLIEES